MSSTGGWMRFRKKTAAVSSDFVGSWFTSFFFLENLRLKFHRDVDFFSVFACS